MADEFPTLEVALAVCVLWLGWRGYVLARGALSLDADVEALAAALGRGEEPRSAGGRGPDATWLEHLARAAFIVAAAPKPDDPAQAPLRERGRRIRRRLRSAAARDLVVCAVLFGALAYARSASLGVSGAFFALGAVSGVLLLLAVAVRLWLDRQVDPTSERLARASGGQAAHARASSHELCPSCGQTGAMSLRGAKNIGKKLTSLGVNELLLCTLCGQVSGRMVKR